MTREKCAKRVVSSQLAAGQFMMPCPYSPIDSWQPGFYNHSTFLFHLDEDGAEPAGEANQAGEDDLDAKAVQAGENLDQFLTATSHAAKEEANSTVHPFTGTDTETRQLQVQVGRLVQDLNQTRTILDALRVERDELRRQLEMSQQQQPRPLPLSAAASMAALSSFQGSPVHQRIAASSRVSSPVVVEEGPVCKVAERVRIRRLDGRDKLLTGSQIASLGVRHLF